MVVKKIKRTANSVSHILKAALRRKKSVVPGYSMRVLARDLGVSPAFISNILNGRQPPPKDRLEDLCYCLELDVLEKQDVVRAVMLDDFGAKILPRESHGRTADGTAGRSAVIRERKTNETTDMNFLSSWVNIAVLEGLTLSAPCNELRSLQTRLGLGTVDIERAIATLLAAGLIQEMNGGLQKKDDHLYIAGARSKVAIRNFHEMMILRARAELLEKTSEEDYQRRLINGFTLALNPEHIERLKAKIIRFQDELSQEAGEGACTEVYQFNLQFFPLTKKL